MSRKTLRRGQNALPRLITQSVGDRCPTTPELVRQAEHPLGNDVGLNLVAAVVDGGGPEVQELFGGLQFVASEADLFMGAQNKDHPSGGPAPACV